MDNARPLIQTGTDHERVIIPRHPNLFWSSGISSRSLNKAWVVSLRKHWANINRKWAVLLFVNTQSSCPVPICLKRVTHSKLDNLAVDLIESNTLKYKVVNSTHYATPLFSISWKRISNEQSQIYQEEVRTEIYSCTSPCSKDQITSRQRICAENKCN